MYSFADTGILFCWSFDLDATFYWAILWLIILVLHATQLHKIFGYYFLQIHVSGWFGDISDLENTLRVGLNHYRAIINWGIKPWFFTGYLKFIGRWFKLVAGAETITMIPKYIFFLHFPSIFLISVIFKQITLFQNLDPSHTLVFKLSDRSLNSLIWGDFLLYFNLHRLGGFMRSKWHYFYIISS